MSKAAKTTLIIISIILALTAAAAIAYFTVGKKYYITRIETYSFPESTFIYITPQDNAESVRAMIEKTGGKTAGEAFAIYAEHNNFDNKKHSGKFALKDGDTMREIYNRIVSNTQTPVKLNIKSTRHLEMCVGDICEQLMMDSTELSEFTGSNAYKMALGYTKETFPSLFLADTYEVYWDIKPEDLMVRIMKEHTKFWNAERKAKAEKMGMTPAEIATLASIVESETKDFDEQPIVAGLYINRLKKGIKLESDPTVLFTLKDPEKQRVYNKDLKTDSPYNTYMYAGLPPGPIRNPSKRGIDNVLNYKEHDYLFMCAKEDLSGRHNFAKTLKEHEKNAKLYHKALDSRGIK